MKKTCLAAVLLSTLIILLTCAGEKKAEIHEGDILFQDFPTPQSEALKLATGSQYTHCGIVFFEDSIPKVWEAVQPVRITPLHEWVARDTTGHFVCKRLKGADTILTPEALEEMKEYATEHLGKNYDMFFEWSDSTMYCSEYVWKIYDNAVCIVLAPLRELGDYDFSHPLVQGQLEMRYGDSIPLDEPVIAPGDLFNSPLLDTVLVR